MITRLYTLFLGLLMVLFVGVGIAAFYPGPTQPEYPNTKTVDENTAAMERFSEMDRQYQQQRKDYDRNVSLMAMGAAIILVILGLTFAKNVTIMGDSLLLGGVFTLGYSIIRGFGTDNTFRFLLVATGLIVAMIIGYLKFIRPLQAAEKSK